MRKNDTHYKIIINKIINYYYKLRRALRVTCKFQTLNMGCWELWCTNFSWSNWARHMWQNDNKQPNNQLLLMPPNTALTSILMYVHDFRCRLIKEFSYNSPRTCSLSLPSLVVKHCPMDASLPFTYTHWTIIANNHFSLLVMHL